MKQQKLIAPACAGLVLLASCGEPDEADAAGPGGPALQQPPPPPSPEVLVALKEQAFGSKLLRMCFSRKRIDDTRRPLVAAQAGYGSLI